jgi:hypothetical protein
MTDSIVFETAVSQEEARLRQLHPTTDDIPSCMTVFDDFLSCNSMLLLFFSSFPGLFTRGWGQFWEHSSNRYTASARWRTVRQNGTSSSFV